MPTLPVPAGVKMMLLFPAPPASVRLVAAGEVRVAEISPAKVGVAPGSRRWGSALRRCMVN